MLKGNYRFKSYAKRQTYNMWIGAVIMKINEKDSVLKFIGISDDFIVMYGTEKNEKPHKHYALQLIIPTNVLTINRELTDKQVLINSNIDHIGFTQGEAVSLFIKPESDLGRRLKERYIKKENIISFYNKQLADKVKAFSKAEISESKIKQLILFILKQLLLDTTPMYYRDNRVNDILNYIKFSDFKELSYEDIIKSVSLSKSRLADVFKKEMGIPVRKYMTWQRLIYATEKLAISHKTITDVAHEYGFSDASHYSRLFKESFGTSPKRIFQNKHPIHVLTIESPYN